MAFDSNLIGSAFAAPKSKSQHQSLDLLLDDVAPPRNFRALPRIIWLLPKFSWPYSNWAVFEFSRSDLPVKVSLRALGNSVGKFFFRPVCMRAVLTHCTRALRSRTPNRVTSRRLFAKMAEKKLDINDVFDQYKPLIDKAMEQHLPRTFNSEGIAHLCGPARYAYDLQTATDSLLVPLWDILDRGAPVSTSKILLRWRNPCAAQHLVSFSLDFC